MARVREVFHQFLRKLQRQIVKPRASHSPNNTSLTHSLSNASVDRTNTTRALSAGWPAIAGTMKGNPPTHRIVSTPQST